MTDPIALAAKVVADPHKRISTNELVSICSALVEAGRTPQVSDELAAATRNLIDAEATHTMAKGADGYAPLKIGLAREMAFLTFKRIFQEEFPDV